IIRCLFFFQAEDGIRDGHVTGVQTCALPILLFAKPVRAEVPKGDLPPFIADPNNDKAVTVSGWNEEELGKALDDFTAHDTSGSRSEERRVGKECRSGWAR